MIGLALKKKKWQSCEDRWDYIHFVITKKLFVRDVYNIPTLACPRPVEKPNLVIALGYSSATLDKRCARERSA